MKETDYLIIGAGIVGCSAAYLLTKDGKKVTIVDKSYPCNEASGVNAGGMELLQQPPRSLPVHILAAELWDMFQNKDDIDCGYHRTGGLYCVLKEEDLPMLDAQAELFAKYNLPIERLSKKQVKEKIPYICDNVIAANFSPMSGYSNPLKAGVAILDKARSLGCSFYDHVFIREIKKTDAGGYLACSDTEEFHANKILITGGIRSPWLLEKLGVHIELEEKHNMITVTEKAPHFIDYTITTPTMTMKQTAEGSILIGGGREGYGDLNSNDVKKDVSINGLCFNVREAQDIIPSINKLNILRSWSGFEGFTPERLPYIGETEKYPGVYYAVTGFCGYCIGPGVAANAIKCMNGEDFFDVRAKA